MCFELRLGVKYHLADKGAAEWIFFKGDWGKTGRRLFGCAEGRGGQLGKVSLGAGESSRPTGVRFQVACRHGIHEIRVGIRLQIAKK